MGLIITVLILGLLASLSPSTIVVFILLLATTRARVNAAAFLIGWSASLVIVFTASYLLGGAGTNHGSGRIVVEVVEIVLGIGLCAVAAHQWRHRNTPRTGSAITKKLTGHLEQLNPWQAAIIGVLEQPWTLTAALAVVLIRHHSAAIIAFVAFLIFTVVSTATVGLIFLYYSRQPGEAEAHLSLLRDRVIEAGPTMFAIVSLLIGVFLSIDGILGIVGG